MGPYGVSNLDYMPRGNGTVPGPRGFRVQTRARLLEDILKTFERDQALDDSNEPLNWCGIFNHTLEDA